MVKTVSTLITSVLILSCSGCKLSCGPSAAQPKPFSHTGWQQWEIDGQVYEIESTYFLMMPKGLHYCIQHPYDFGDSSSEQMTREQALRIAFPLMRYAYKNGLHEKGVVIGGRPRLHMAVALFEGEGPNAKGYNVVLSIDELRDLIEQGEHGGTIPGP